MKIPFPHFWNQLIREAWAPLSPKPWLHCVTCALIVNESMDGRSRHKPRKWIHVIVNGNIAETTARCLRDIAIDYNVYSLPGSMARTATHTSQWHISRRERGSGCKSRIGLATWVQYAYACISRDTAVCLNLAKQHHSVWTSFSLILTKMIWIYQRFGGAVSFNRNIGETWNLKCIILITFFYSNIKQKWWKTIPNWKLKNRSDTLVKEGVIDQLQFSADWLDAWDRWSPKKRRKNKEEEGKITLKYMA